MPHTSPSSYETFTCTPEYRHAVAVEAKDMTFQAVPLLIPAPIADDIVSETTHQSKLKSSLAKGQALLA